MNARRLPPSLSRRAFLRGLGATAAGLFAGGGGRRLPAAEGRRHSEDRKDLFLHSEFPLNGEPALASLVQSWITPVKHFYVRSNGNLPLLEPDAFRLTVDGLVRRELTLDVRQLRDGFRRTSIVATLTCAGNRRHELDPPVEGVPWQAGAIGNARWTGVRLSDVLRAAGLRESARHVWFEGLDRIESGGGTTSFGGSIPLEKAFADTASAPGALLAWDMNDAPLTPEHGSPLRAVVPGFIGARSVKWLGRITVSDRPSENRYLARAYKLVTESGDEALAAAAPIYEYPINSVIAVPEPGAGLKAGRERVRGYALATGKPGRTVERVELSVDGGRSWREAGLLEPSQEFCWRLWEADVPLRAGAHSLLVRATDSAGDVQPEQPAWNRLGYCCNGWHRVPVTVEPGP